MKSQITLQNLLIDLFSLLFLQQNHLFVANVKALPILIKELCKFSQIPEFQFARTISLTPKEDISDYFQNYQNLLMKWIIEKEFDNAREFQEFYPNLHSMIESSFLVRSVLEGEIQSSSIIDPKLQLEIFLCQYDNSIQAKVDNNDVNRIVENRQIFLKNQEIDNENYQFADSFDEDPFSLQFYKESIYPSFSQFLKYMNLYNHCCVMAEIKYDGTLDFSNAFLVPLFY
jgi:hypothetical protein